MAGKITKQLSEVTGYLNGVLSVDQNFDILNRTLTIGGRDACIYLIDGFAKDELLQKIVQYFCALKPEEMPPDAAGMMKEILPYTEVDLLLEEEAIIKNILSGVPILFIDGYEGGIAIDCRTYPARSVDEPEKDRVLRGSRDGFVETIVFNTALIRRRIRDPKLTMKMLEVGKASKTDVVVCYIAGRVRKELLDNIVKRIETLSVDALTMNQESLAESLYHSSWLNPFPKFKFSERPDTAAASVLEGSIVILVDNSPSVMIIPTSIFDIVEEANDYYFPPVTGTYLRLSRFLVNFVSLLLTPTFLLLTMEPQLVSERFAFILVKDVQNIPLIWQFLILEFAIDGLRLASLNTPNMLSTPLSVVAGLVIGEFTVSSGWFNAEAMLYMSFVAIASYAQASFEMGYALKFFRLITLVLTALFSYYGYIAGILFAIVAVCFNRTLAGTSYLYPLIPFNGKQLLKRFFRVSLRKSEESQKLN